MGGRGAVHEQGGQQQQTCGEVVRRSSRLAATSKRNERDVSQAHFVGWADDSLPRNDKSVALKTGLAELPSSAAPLALFSTLPSETPAASGLWGLLPEELTETILKLCSPPQLGMLQTSCSYFYKSKLIERISKQKLKVVPRARGLKPNKKEKETYVTLLHFVNCQSAAAAQATAVACGAYHTAALMIPREQEKAASSSALRHTLYTFGRGFHGQLGASDFSDCRTPSNVSLGFRSCQENCQLEEETMPAVVACGAHHSASISRRGELFTWGLGSSGELGQGRWTPVEVSGPRQCLLPQVRIVSVTCGANHTLAIGEAGSLWSCGKNCHGELGLGNLLESFRLQMVQNLQGYRIVSAAAGVSHSMALASDGSLFTWGEGGRGQLGHSQLQQVAAMVQANNPITMPLPQKIARLDPAILEPGNRVTAIAAGNYHSMALTVGGSILGFGGNSNGCLGLSDLNDRWKPTKVPLALEGEEGRCIRVVQLVCGALHTVALVSNQGSLEVRTTGCNAWGQLGQGDRQQRLRFTPTAFVPGAVAVQAGEEHTAAVTSSGDLYMWGRGDCGQLGLGDARAKWRPTMVKDFVVVHPDKTLRRNKRNQPYVRPAPSMQQDAKRQRMSEMAHFM